MDPNLGLVDGDGDAPFTGGRERRLKPDCLEEPCGLTSVVAVALLRTPPNPLVQPTKASKSQFVSSLVNLGPSSGYASRSTCTAQLESASGSCHTSVSLASSPSPLVAIMTRAYALLICTRSCPPSCAAWPRQWSTAYQAKAAKSSSHGFDSHTRWKFARAPAFNGRLCITPFMILLACSPPGSMDVGSTGIAASTSVNL